MRKESNNEKIVIGTRVSDNSTIVIGTVENIIIVGGGTPKAFVKWDDNKYCGRTDTDTTWEFLDNLKIVE